MIEFIDGLVKNVAFLIFFFAVVASASAITISVFIVKFFDSLGK